MQAHTLTYAKPSTLPILYYNQPTNGGCSGPANSFLLLDVESN